MPRRAVSGQRSGSPVHIRTSERKTFKRCPQRWWWSYREGLTSASPSLALWFGSGVHISLAQYYQPGYKRDFDGAMNLWEEWCDSEGDAEGMYLPASEMGEEWVEARALGLIMLEGYHRQYAGDPDWDVIATEQDFQVMFTADSGLRIEYDGTFDGVYRDRSTKHLRLMEHKTCKALPNFGHLVLDDQAGSYFAVASTILRHKGLMTPKENIWGITYNYLRKGTPDTRPTDPQGYSTNNPKKDHYVEALKDVASVDEFPTEKLRKMKIEELDGLAAQLGVTVVGDRSANQPTPLFARKDIRKTRGERANQIERIKAEAMHMEAMRTGLLPVYKNPTLDCSWDCAFFELCGLDESGVDTQEYRDSVYKIEDPYAAHRSLKVA